jgi:hypothetical protein
MNTKLIALLAVALVLLPAAFADEGAIWLPVPIHFSWDLSMGGACTRDSQCLLSSIGNASYDGDASRWYRYTDLAQWPRCMNNTQSILDYSCERGNWTTRTKHVALQLLKLADDTSPTNFALVCDSYDRVLNQYQYLLKNVLVQNYLDNSCAIEGTPEPCVNSLCVLRTPTLVAVGATLNAPIADAQHSFLLALNASSTALCNNVNPQSTNFVSCGEHIWYNPQLNAAILLPTGTLVPPPAADARLTGPLATMSSYVMAVLNNANNAALNFAYFPRTRLFGHVAVIQNGSRNIFGFLEPNMRPETIDNNPTRMDYIGVRYAGIDLGPNPCLNIIKTYDDNAFCENQTAGTGFNVIARHRCEPTQPNCQGASPIVQVWSALTGKLRP